MRGGKGSQCLLPHALHNAQSSTTSLCYHSALLLLVQVLCAISQVSQAMCKNEERMPQKCWHKEFEQTEYAGLLREVQTKVLHTQLSGCSRAFAQTYLADLTIVCGLHITAAHQCTMRKKITPPKLSYLIPATSISWVSTTESRNG
eukprot:1001776-Pelagomonas_calceolata.AAC.3